MVKEICMNMLKIWKLFLPDEQDAQQDKDYE